MRGKAAFLAALLVAALHGAESDEMLVARRALGDSLWDVAVEHAAKAANVATSSVERVTARLMELEALAGAERAPDMLKRLEVWTDQNDDKFRFWRAWALERLGRVEEARKLLDTPFADPPSALLVLRLKARMEAKAENFPVAVAAFVKVSAALKGDAAARAKNAIEWADCLRRSGKAKDALVVLESEGALTAKGSDGDDARLLAAELRQELGEISAAAEIYGKLVEGGTNTDERAYVLAACEWSRLLMDQAQTNSALVVCSNAVARARQAELAMRARFYLGFALLGSGGARGEGRALISETVRRFPGTSESDKVQQDLAKILLAAGDAEAAGREYEVLLQAFTGHALDPLVLVGRGEAYSRQGRRSEAVGLFARAAQVATNLQVKARCMFKQAETLAADGRHEESAAVYAQVREPSLMDRAQLCRADQLARALKTDEAAKLFAELAKGQGEMAVDAELRLAALDVSLGKVEDAIAIYGRMLSAEVKLSAEQREQALFGRGKAHYRAYRFNEASADFAAVSKLRAERRDEMDFLCALCSYGAGNNDEAAKSVQAIVDRCQEGRLLLEMRLWLARYHASRRAWVEAIAGFENCATNSLVPVDRQAEAFVRAARCAAEMPDFQRAVELAGKAVALPTRWVGEAQTLQGEALIELGRFEEALLVLERAIRVPISEAVRQRAELARADCLFAMGADDSNRYRAALAAYRALAQNEDLSPSMRIRMAFKQGRTLEKLRNFDEARDLLYQHVLLAYWEGSRRDASGMPKVLFDSSAREVFARAAFMLADRYEERGEFSQSIRMLEYVVRAGVDVKDEAARRIARLKEKGGYR